MDYPITLKELASELNCSYEAIRQHTKRYKNELEGHISYIGKSQYLDEWACDFIKSKRVESPITVHTVVRDERIKQLEEQVTMLQAKVVEQAEKLASQAEELRASDKALSEVNVLLLNSVKEKERADVLEAQNTDLSLEIEKKDKHLQEVTEELKSKTERLQAMENRTLWQRIRNR